MKITGSSLLTPTQKTIQFYNNCIVANEGPNQVAKQNLANLSIKYDSVFSARQTIAPDTIDQPIMYGFLGTDITFLSIVPTYTEEFIQTCSGTTNYLEYWFEDQPLIRRTFTSVLVLSGDDIHRIPQIYIHNPSNNTVYLDILAANLDNNTISSNLYPEYTELNGLSFSSVITDQIYGLNCTGSTQFEILDLNDNTQMVIEITKIDIIKIEDNILIVYTTSDDPIKLNFLSNFNAQQTLSKMNWVIENTVNRYITKTYPVLDTTPPTITFNPHTNPTIMTSLPIYKSDLIFRFIDNVTDYDNNNVIRDGIINNNDINVIIIDTKTGVEVSSITYDSSYSVTFNIKDLAGNTTNETKNVVVDSTAPIFIFNSGITNTMDLSADTITPGIINYSDIEIYYINHIWDDVDGIITNVSTIISSGSTTYTGITLLGDYNITFTTSDSALNIATADVSLKVIETEAPIINYTFTGDTFTMSISGDSLSTTGITEDDIKTFAVLGITDNYDGILNINNLSIIGVLYPITSVGVYNITFDISDSSLNQTNDAKILNIIS